MARVGGGAGGRAGPSSPAFLTGIKTTLVALTSDSCVVMQPPLALASQKASVLNLKNVSLRQPLRERTSYTKLPQVPMGTDLSFPLRVKPLPGGGAELTASGPVNRNRY